MISSKKPALPVITGDHSMNWKELSEADDLASAITVDVFLGFSTHKMTDMKLRIPERIKKKLRDVLVDFQKQKCYETAYSNLTSDFNIVKPSWRSDIRFRNHVYRYLLLFDDRSGIEIRPCYRYASEGHVGAAVFATKAWPKGSRITTLVGCIAELNRSEEAAFLKHHKNDFSVMYSSRKNCSQLWLGPASYVNHDCQPNCEFTINCDIDARMSLEVKMDIKNGDEIFIFYGNHFFDVNNSACECFTCELLGRGYFSKFDTVDPATPLLSIDNQNSNAAMFAITSERSNGTFSSVSGSSNAFANRATNNHRNDSTNNLSSDTIVPSVLRKGSSTGLARRSFTSPYSLRHTGSRLNRVKARIMASTTNLQTNGLPAVSPNVVDCKCKTSENTRPPENLKSQANKRTSSTIIMNSIPVRRSLRLCSSVPVASLCCTEASPSSFLSSSRTSIVKWPEVPVVGHGGTVSGSPIPPQLERMSVESCDLLSTRTNTTLGFRTSYNQNRTDCNCNNLHQTESVSTWHFNNQSPSREGSLSSWCNTLPYSLSPGASSATSPACVIEPILGRLWSETQPGSLPSPSKSTFHSSPPLLTRQHTGPQLPDLFGNSSPSPSRTRVTRLAEPSTPPYLQAVDICEAKTAQVHRIPPTNPGYDSFNTAANTSVLDGYSKVVDYNSVLSPPSSLMLDSSPPNLTPVSLVGSYRVFDGKPEPLRTDKQTSKGCTTNAGLFSVSTDTYDPPKGLYCNTSLDQIPSEVSGQANQSADYTASPPELRTPLKTKSSLNYMVTEHDYAKPVILPSLRFRRVQSSTTNKLTTLCGSKLVPTYPNKTLPFKLPALAVHTTFDTVVGIANHSPSPPTLQPATSARTPSPSFSDGRKSTCFTVLPEPSVFPQSHHVSSTKPESTSNAHHLAHCLWSPVNMASRSTCPIKRPLIVTLKRVGPEHYQISQPNRFFLP